MIKIKRIGSKANNISYYKFDSNYTTHHEIQKWLFKINFETDQINKMDMLFPELEGEYIYIENDEMKIHFFFTKNDVTMVIDSTKKRDEISKLIETDFSLKNE